MAGRSVEEDREGEATMEGAAVCWRMRIWEEAGANAVDGAK